MFPMARQTAAPIWTKLDMGTWMEPGNILGKVKVNVERQRRENRGAAGADRGWVRPDDG